MNKENQNIEYKESWHDDYLKWICGFANAQGGKLYIGINDEGHVIGLKNSKKLIEDIPNKVRDILGILVEVNCLNNNELQYIEIVVEAYPYPISYRGHYYQRSGATNQELKGASLDRFMLRKQGKTWDSVPIPFLHVDDLDNDSIYLFRKYARLSGRMDEADLKDDNIGLLDKLRLFDGDYLKRAAVLLFHKDPEKYVTGAYVKIGFFREDADLVFQDEIHGNLFQQISKMMDLLCTKYLKAVITYEGIQRIETLPIPKEALREALLNACINKDYSDTSPIQIKVTDNTLQIVNGGILPDGWTVDTLLSPHRSMPYNPEIANTFFRAGEIEAWGRGIERIVKSCKQEGLSTVEFRYDVCGIWTTFKYKYSERVVNIDKENNILASLNKSQIVNKLSEKQLLILSFIAEDDTITTQKMSQKMSLKEESMQRAIKRELAELQSKGILAREGSRRNGRWIILLHKGENQEKY